VAHSETSKQQHATSAGPAYESFDGHSSGNDRLPAYAGETLGRGVVLCSSMDLQETDNSYVLTAELPGIDPQNIDISVRNGVLELKGEKREEKESDQSGTGWTERRYGAFHRQIPFDQEIKEDEVKASCKNGILRIEVPKAEAGSGGKSIPARSLNI